MSKNTLQGTKNVDTMFDQQRQCGYNERLDKLEKKVSALLVLVVGYLAGHFIGLLLF